MRILVIAFVASFASQAQAQDFMSGSQIRSAISGRTVTHVSPRSGRPVTMRFSPGGGLRSTVGRRKDKCRWWVQGNVFKMKCQKLQKGRTISHKFVRRGSNKLIRYNRRNKRKPGIDWSIK